MTIDPKKYTAAYRGSGIAILAHVVALFAGFTVLGLVFDFPDVLRRPAVERLALYSAHQPIVQATYWLLAMTGFTQIAITGFLFRTFRDRDRATLLFALSQAATKWLVADYSFAEVLFFRGFGSLLIVSALILPRHGLAVFRTQRLAGHLGRNAAQSVAQSLIVIALSLMPLAGAVAINFSAPLFAALVAAVWLHERIGRARGMVLVVGFAGVLLIASPGAESFNIGTVFALANAVMYGSVTAMVRGLSATESTETLTMHQMVFLTLFFAAGSVVFGFAWPRSGIDWSVLMVNGVLNGIGQYWWTRALSLAPAAAANASINGCSIARFILSDA